jgi:hypothetical protein
MHHKTLALGLLLAIVPALPAQDATQHNRGRKYKPPPETSHIEVIVTKGYNHKPIENAAVIFHELRADGADEGNLEVKTDPDGKAVIDVIPTGSNVRVQVLANGFATYAEDFLVTESSRQIPVTMLRPKEQISTYVDNDGKSSTRKAGVQEPIRPKTNPPASNTVPVPASTTPPKAPPLPPSEQNTPAPVSNPAPTPPQN